MDAIYRIKANPPACPFSMSVTFACLRLVLLRKREYYREFGALFNLLTKVIVPLSASVRHLTTAKPKHRIKKKKESIVFYCFIGQIGSIVFP